jgi:hypothetical protein
MTDEPKSQQVKGTAQKATRPPRGLSGKEARRKLEELGPERRVELAQQIEAKRLRGKPPSILSRTRDQSHPRARRAASRHSFGPAPASMRTQSIVPGSC